LKNIIVYNFLDEFVEQEMSYGDKMKVITSYGLTKAHRNYGDYFKFLDEEDFEEDDIVENYLTIRILTELISL
jgi:hypothetical protein